MPRQDKLKKLACLLIEVVRSTNEGIGPLSQKDIQYLLRKRWKVNLPPSTMSDYTRELQGLGWININGHKVSLAKKGDIIIDSRAIKALFIAMKIMDEDDNFFIDTWITKCKKFLNIEKERYEEFLVDYAQCGYIDTMIGTNGIVHLDIIAINGHYFYLRQALRAKLRKHRGRPE